MRSKLRPGEPPQAGISIGNASELCDIAGNSKLLMKAARIFLLAVLAGDIAANLCFAQTWTQTSAPSNLWTCVASSANGTKLIASVYAGGIWLSQDSGATWRKTSAPETGWGQLACSADGDILFAVGDYYTGYSRLLSFCASTNSGLTWTSTNISTNPYSGSLGSLVCSADGSKMAALLHENTNYFLCTSSDFGASLVISILTNGVWGVGISSADGNRLVVVGTNSCISTNAGVSWVVTNSLSNPNYLIAIGAIAASADGMRLIGAQVAGSAIYISTNGGFTWVKATAPSGINWMAVAASADGSKLAAVGAESAPLNGGIGPGMAKPIFTSTNSGATWKSNNVPAHWKSIASSADGSKLVAAIEYFDEHLIGGGIWTSQSKPTPSIQITPANNNLRLSWLVPSTNFVLQSSTDLSGWTDLTNQPALNLTNLQNEVFLPFSGSGGFFRLKTP
jgi:hypothetical protein